MQAARSFAMKRSDRDAANRPAGTREALPGTKCGAYAPRVVQFNLDEAEEENSMSKHCNGLLLAKVGHGMPCPTQKPNHVTSKLATRPQRLAAFVVPKGARRGRRPLQVPNAVIP
jgi:hypothetical protein